MSLSEVHHLIEIRDLLREISSELKDIREAFDSFSNGGFPLSRTVPTPELLASLAAASSLIARNTPLEGGHLQNRIAAAQVIAQDLIRQHDHYRQSIQAQKLDSLWKD